MDTGLLILRLVVGVALVGHGTQKLFGWFGGHGRRGTGAFFELLGYRPGVLFAVIAGLSETGGGTLLALGLLTPLAGATIVGVMLNAAWALRERGPWVTNGGWEYPVVLATVGASVALTGPGSVSVDNGPSGLTYGIAVRVRGPRCRRIGVRIRRADGTDSNSSGGSIAAASPSSAKSTTAPESIRKVGVVHSRNAGNGLSGPTTVTPSKPRSIPLRAPVVGRGSSS